MIEDEQDGFLAGSPPEWGEKLFALVGSAELRRAVGERAHADVRARHTTSATAEAQSSALAALAGPLPQPGLGRRGAAAAGDRPPRQEEATVTAG